MILSRTAYGAEPGVNEQSLGGKRVTRNRWIGIMLMGALAALSACDQREVIFSGERESLYSPDPDVVGERAAAEFARQEAEAEQNRSQPIRLSSQSSLGSWTHVAGSNTHNVPHLAFSNAPQVVFEVPIGQGNGRKHKITAEPIVAEGRVFTMDSQAMVTAHSTGGAALWSADLTPASDRVGEASGGGLAYGAGQVFATTGFGELIAINPASGAIQWRQDLGAPGSGAPTVSGSTVYALNTVNKAVAVNATNGRLVWQTPGTPDKPGVLGSSAPAIAGNTVVTPFSIGSLVGIQANDGEPTWAVQLKQVRRGRAFAQVSDFSGAPVVSGGTIYAGTAAGGLTAVSTNGQQRWVSQEGAMHPVTVAGGSLFMVGDDIELVRVNASNGERIWGVPLPGYTKENPRRRKAIHPSYGPTLAGGRLWVASGDGYLRAFNPTDGALVSAVELPAGAASRPVIVGGVAYIATEKGTLLALR